MATVCYVCNKERQTGSKVSHSNRHSNRRWNPNIKRVKALVDGSPKKSTSVPGVFVPERW